MSKATTRPPAVAGMFYPDSPSELRGIIDHSFRSSRFGPGRGPPSGNKRRIYGIVSPHAGVAGELVVNGENGYVCTLEAELWAEHAASLLAQQEKWERQNLGILEQDLVIGVVSERFESSVGEIERSAKRNVSR